MVKLPDSTTMKASDKPPSLSHIANKSTREWVYSVAERSAGLCLDGNHAEFQVDRQRCARRFRIPDREQHAVPGDSVDGFGPSPSWDPAAGASLYGESFCASCHAVQNASWKYGGRQRGTGVDEESAAR